MKASELITSLQWIMSTQGDIPVKIAVIGEIPSFNIRKVGGFGDKIEIIGSTPEKDAELDAIYTRMAA